MKRKLWILAAALCLLLSLAVFANAADIVDSGTCGENLTWTLDSEGTLTISGTGDMKEYCYYEDGVFYITRAPWCYKSSSIKTVVIEPGVTSIGGGAFHDCSGLTSITIPDSVTSIGEWAFHDCDSLTSVTIGDSVTSIGEDAFAWCESLQSITIPDGVTSIGDYAFFNCSSLTSVTISESLTSISGYMFHGCSSLTSVIIPDSVTSIGEWAFYECNSLTNIILPDSMTSLDRYAFYGCSSLTSITIPESVTNVGQFAFACCSGLTSITIPDSMTSLDHYAFYGCSSLTSITIPESVTNVGQFAFARCSGLTSITIPDSVTSIGSSAFFECSGLTSVTIPEGVTSISGGAFRDCSSLTSITIPGSVTTIGKWVFDSCTSLTEIKFCGDAPEMGETPFGGVTATAYYPANNPTWTEEAMQDYGGNITWIPYGQQEKIDLAGANLELANDITMYFYVNAADVADGYYMEIVKTNADGTKVTKQVAMDDWTAYGDAMYYVGFNGMAAKEMADEISVTVYNAEGVQVSNTTVTSVSAYALRALDNAAYASMHTLMADLLNYGAAAQTFFKYNTSNLANANMTETHQSYATKGFDMSKYTNDVVVGAGVVGANLSLETNILQNFYFDPAVVDSTMTAKVTYTNYKGVKKTAQIGGDKFGTTPGYGYVTVEVAVLVPADVMSLVSVEIVDANGDVVASVSDSISSYAVRANTSSPDPLYIELMEYCLSCESYFS